MFERYGKATEKEPELTVEQAQENLKAWSTKNKPATRSDAQLVIAAILLFFFFASRVNVILPTELITNNQIESPRGPNAKESSALRAKMAKYHQPRALFNLLINGQE